MFIIGVVADYGTAQDDQLRSGYGEYELIVVYGWVVFGQDPTRENFFKYIVGCYMTVGYRSFNNHKCSSVIDLFFAVFNI